MLSDTRVVATLPVSDLGRARRFYAGMLSLEPVRELPEGLLYECSDGTRFLLYVTTGVPVGEHTQLAFVASDLESEVADLKSDGVVFEEYDLPNLKTVHSIAYTQSGQSAWFRDSEGNLLALNQRDED
jgi:catechol 2,3-dioxygenase-like lactoylglutathione lyase family enzyme